MGVTENGLGVKDMLKNALQWKQWMVDDLRLLIEVSENEQMSKASLHSLIAHHLQTYELVNQTYAFVTGDVEEKLFDLPNIEQLREILPTLDLSNQSSDGVIEPMLELELDGLSEELRDETVHPVSETQEKDEGVSEDSEDSNMDNPESSESMDSNEGMWLDELDGLEYDDDEDVDEPEDETEAYVEPDEQDWLTTEDPDVFDGESEPVTTTADALRKTTDVSTTDIVNRLWGGIASGGLTNNSNTEQEEGVEGVHAGVQSE